MIKKIVLLVLLLFLTAPALVLGYRAAPWVGWTWFVAVSALYVRYAKGIFTLLLYEPDTRARPSNTVPFSKKAEQAPSEEFPTPAA